MSHARVFALLGLLGCSKGSDLAGIDYTQYPLASGTRIDKVSIYQGVEKPLFRANGVFNTGSRPPPIVADREATVRIHVSPEDPDTWIPREVAVVLDYDDGSYTTQVADVRVLEGGWDQGDLASTAVVRIPPQRINADMTLTVSIRDTSGASVVDPPEAPQLWTSATEGLDVLESDTITVNVIPIEYNGDGSGRLPDTSATTIASIRSEFLAMYPARDVAVVVDDPLPWPDAIPGTSQGAWTSLLLEISRRRSEAQVRENTYFYALFDPGGGMDGYCSRGCILGLSLLPPTAGDTWARASMGVDFAGETAGIMLHEVGHAHGREHAPCGLYGQPSDPGYPYPNAQLGSWGFHLGSQQLIDANATADVMSYCHPQWVSDYTFTALFERISALKGLRSSGRRLDWQMLAVHEDGTASLGGTAKAGPIPGGEVVQFELLDAEGGVVDVTDGWFVPFDHLDGGIALIEPTRRSVASARLAD